MRKSPRKTLRSSTRPRRPEFVPLSHLEGLKTVIYNMFGVHSGVLTVVHALADGAGAPRNPGSSLETADWSTCPCSEANSGGGCGVRGSVRVRHPSVSAGRAVPFISLKHRIFQAAF